VDGDQGERSGELAAHLPHRLAEVAVSSGVDLLEQVGGDLGVGVGSELVPGRGEVFAQSGEILDDPVVDHRDPAAAVDVGVGVAIGRSPVGRPPGMPHTHCAPRQGAGR
jgi:hypothetical protein